MTSTAKDLLAPLTAPKLPIVYAKGSLRFKKVKLDTALNGFEVNLEGGGGADFVWFDENSTANTGATMTLDDESSSAALPVGPCRGFRDVPAKRVFITCAALTGGVLNMWYGKGAYIYGQTPGAKGQWYDRNPLAVVNTYFNNAIAPHSDVARWTYTVPAARKCAVQLQTVNVARETAAAPVGDAWAYISYLPSGGAEVSILVAINVANTVGAGQVMSAGGQMIILAGDTIKGRTRDGSTGGTQAYQASMQGLEFDA